MLAVIKERSKAFLETIWDSWKGNANEKFGTVYGNVLYVSDLMSLKIEEELNDQIINLYCSVLQKRTDQCVQRVSSADCLILTSIFEGRKSVTWFKKDDIQQYDTVIGCINDRKCHWVAVVMDVQHHIVTIMDPLKISKKLRTYEKNFNYFTKSRDLGTWTICTAVGYPLQNDLSSCGVYCLKGTEMFGFLASSLNVQTIVLGLIVGMLVYRFTRRRKYNLPPGPFALPLIGNYEVLKAKFLHEKFVEYKKRYGPVFKIHLGGKMVVVLNDINTVTEALVSKKADFANRPKVLPAQIISEGGKDIAFAEYSKLWKLQRKIAVKALRQYMSCDHLERAVQASMTKCLDHMRDEIEAFNPEPYIDLMVYNVLDAIVYGESANLDSYEFQRLMELYRDMNTLIGGGLAEETFPFLAKICPTNNYRRFVAVVNEILDMHRQKLTQHQQSFDPDNIRDLTDYFILCWKEAEVEESQDKYSQLTETHLVQTIADIFMAGINTQRLTLYFAVRCMAGSPDIQSKVQDELDTAIGHDRLPSLKDRENLRYSEAVLQEAMRMYPVVPIALPHCTTRDTTVGGYDVPVHTEVMVNLWALMHDPNYWEDVNKFDPTRYMNNNKKKPECWLPFSTGYRSCLGETVAQRGLHLIFSAIFQRFNISLAGGTNQNIKLAGSSYDFYPEQYKIIAKERI